MLKFNFVNRLNINENKQFDNVRMIEFAQILDFASNFADNIEILDLLSIHDFHGHFCTALVMNSNWK